MTTEEQIQLIFEGVHIFKVDFSTQGLNNDKSVDFNLDAKIMDPKGDNARFGIVMTTKLSRENNFKLEIGAIGHFKINGEVTPEIRSSFINVNAPAIVFPYIRAFITNLTSSLGREPGPIILPPQFFKGQLDTVRDDMVSIF